MRKTNNVVSEQVRHKPSCTSKEDGYRLEILDLESRGIAAKTKALISFAVTAKLICVLFSYMQNVGLYMTLLIYILF